jgi:hypothetical protein
MRIEPEADKVYLSKEDYQYYQQRRKECKVYEPERREFKQFNNKRQFKKRY